MKLFVYFCSLAFLIVGAFGRGYHEDVGIPEAARIMVKEARQMNSRIIGGMPSGYSDNPHLAGLIITLMKGQMSVCSGTMLSTRKILTAGQCWYDGYNQGKSVQVVLGSLKLFSGSRYDVSGVAVHPQYNPRKLTNDLAMLTLRYNTYINEYQKPARLPNGTDVNNMFVGEFARVSGFGKTSDWSSVGPDTEQQAVSVLVTDRWDCYQKLAQRPDSYYNNLVCTDGANGWGTCGGDLGGPLVLQDYYNGSDVLIGVTSIQSPFGCQTGFATGYTRVTAYLSWIQRNL